MIFLWLYRMIFWAFQMRVEYPIEIDSESSPSHDCPARSGIGAVQAELQVAGVPSIPARSTPASPALTRPLPIPRGTRMETQGSATMTDSPYRFAGRAEITSGVVGINVFGFLIAGLALRLKSLRRRNSSKGFFQQPMSARRRDSI